MNADKRLEDIATLLRNPLLAGLALGDMGALLERLEVVTLSASDVLPQDHVQGAALGFVLEGTVRCALGTEAPVELAAGSDFGALSLFGNDDHANVVTAIEAARVALLRRVAFEALGSAHPIPALHLAARLLSRLGTERRQRDANTSVTSPPSVDARHDQGAGAGTSPGPRVADVVRRVVDGSLVVAALRDHLAVSLDAPLLPGEQVTPVTTRTWEGREIYRRTAGLVLLEAAAQQGLSSLRLGPSITSGRVVWVDVPAEQLPALASTLCGVMRELIAQDLPVREERWRLDDAVAYFTAKGWKDAATLLEFWQVPSVSLAALGSVRVPSPGTMLPRTSFLEGVTVLTHPLGLVLDFGPAIRRELPRVEHSTRVLELRAPRFGSEMTRGAQPWLTEFGATSVGTFNQACVSGQVRELIHVSEGFHEKRIALIADQIRARGGVRVVAVAGPSSSGKTTFIKRLKVQLQVNGIRPVELSLDDYYLDRERSPRDANGKHDFEQLEALDRPLLREQVERLLSGESLATARYDFASGSSLPAGGRTLCLAPRDVLLVEGLHALNPALFDSDVTAHTFRVFIHPATAIRFDHLSIFEPADVRLLRRIVRDRHQRGFPASDNLERWASVRRGERVHIFPHQGEADAVFDSSLAYEVSVLRVYAERYLLEVSRSHPEFSAAYRLRGMLGQWVPIHPDHVPPMSILREFIGGSGFSY